MTRLIRTFLLFYAPLCVVLTVARTADWLASIAVDADSQIVDMQPVPTPQFQNRIFDHSADVSPVYFAGILPRWEMIAFLVALPNLRIHISRRTPSRAPPALP